MTQRLFVYGSLAPGGPNHHVLAGLDGDPDPVHGHVYILRHAPARPLTPHARFAAAIGLAVEVPPDEPSDDVSALAVGTLSRHVTKLPSGKSDWDCEGSPLSVRPSLRPRVA